MYNVHQGTSVKIKQMEYMKYIDLTMFNSSLFQAVEAISMSSLLCGIIGKFTYEVGRFCWFDN